MICDLCGKDERNPNEIFHYSGLDGSGHATFLFDPDFDQGIYCYECIKFVEAFYYFQVSMNYPIVAVSQSKELCFLQEE